ncbi:24374_t:CDS:2, partial [Racocetra persica]
DYTHTKQIILGTLKHTIYNSLFDYWSEPIIVGLLALLLDPQLKTLASWSDEIQEIAKNELIHQFKKLTELNSTSSNHTTNMLNNNNFYRSHLYSSIFGISNRNSTASNSITELELSRYPDEP